MEIVYALSCLDGPPVYVGLSGPGNSRAVSHWNGRFSGTKPVQLWLRKIRKFADLTVTSLCEIPTNFNGSFQIDPLHVESLYIREIGLNLLRTTGLVLLNVTHNSFRAYRDPASIDKEAVHEATKYMVAPPRARLAESVGAYSFCKTVRCKDELATEALQIALGVR